MSNKLDSGALEIFGGAVPELADAGLRLECVARLTGGEALYVAVGLGPEAVLLLALHALPELLLLRKELLQLS